MEFPSSASSVDEWLEAINMGKYSGAFAQAGITLHHLCGLQDDQLKQIGVAMVGQRKRLIQAGMALNVEPPSASASAATVTSVPAQAAEDVDMADATLEPGLALPPNKDPDQRRPNSTSSYYINSTITRPDTDEIVFCVAVVLHDRILQDEQAGTDERTAFPYFCEENSPLYAEPSLHNDKRKKREVPSEDTIFHSIRSIYECARFPQECLIISMVYIERLVAMSKAAILVTSWRPILLAALVLAQKVWDDRSLHNIDFSVFCPMFTLKEINHLEKKFLELIDYDVSVNMSVYASYYFQLRTLCQHNDQDSSAFPLKPMDAATAASLEARGLSIASELKKEAKAKTWHSADDADLKLASMRSR